MLYRSIALLPDRSKRRTFSVGEYKTWATVQDTPNLLRSMTSGQRVSILSASTLCSLLNSPSAIQVIYRKDKLYSAAQRLNYGGHNSERAFRDYYMPYNDTDGQNSYPGGELRRIVTDLFRGMTLSCNPDHSSSYRRRDNTT